jgi:predicted AAA+ superfamily ATPase
LFNTLAYNTGNEMSLSELAKSANVAKNTLSRYVEYLEAAFLIKRIRRVDSDAAHFKRVTTFKVYLTNPTMRTALFSPVDEHHEAIGQLAETAVFSQWLHNTMYIDSLYYARWERGEVDLVSLDPQQRPVFAIEVKWSDRPAENPKKIKSLLQFARRHKLARKPLVTTRTITATREIDGVAIDFVPCSLHCYTVGKNTLEQPK